VKSVLGSSTLPIGIGHTLLMHVINTSQTGSIMTWVHIIHEVIVIVVSTRETAKGIFLF